MGLLNMSKAILERKNFMKSTFFLALACALGLANADEDAVVTERKISVAAFVDAGQVVHGVYVNDDGTNAKEVRDVFMNRDGVGLTYSGTLNGNLHMNIGVGGLFWKPFLTTEAKATKKINFGPGISEASTQYDFNPRLTVKFGYFGYKYNPDATNLGEYLLRSEAYPTIIQNGNSGGWVWLGNENKSMGAKVTWDLLDGAFRQDFLLFSEFSANPLFDFSPSYVATWKVGKGFEIAGGFSLHRWLSIKPSATTPSGLANTVAEIPVTDPRDAALFATSKSAQSAFSGGKLTAPENLVSSFKDSANNDIASQVWDAQGNLIYIVTSTGDTLRPAKETKLTFKAIEVMGRASLNFSNLLGIDEKVTGPFKLYGEIAVLGLQNQPYYYEDRTQRMPIMLGADIPTFHLLDLFSVQMEYLKNPWPDFNYDQYTYSMPVPSLPGSPTDYALRKQAGFYNRDDLKWSVNLQKTIVTGWQAHLQVANDHLRVQDEYAQPSFMPVTQGKSDWYYLVQFLWSM